MLHAALLAVVLASSPSGPSQSIKTPVQQCFESMDGAVYHGDPADRTQMKANVAACAAGAAQIQKTRIGAAQGPEKLFLTGRILDRAATLSYIGLGDSATALREVTAANLYFRIAAGLADQSADYHAAALANAELTRVQLRTLHADVAAANSSAAATVALRTRRVHHPRRAAAGLAGTEAYTAYHRL